MNILQTLRDLLLRFVSIDKNLTDLEETAKDLAQNNAALREKLQELSERVVALESTCATKSDLQELVTRVSVLEESRSNEKERVEIELQRFQLQIERFGVQMSRLPSNQPPQLPPTPTTDN